LSTSANGVKAILILMLKVPKKKNRNKKIVIMSQGELNW